MSVRVSNIRDEKRRAILSTDVDEKRRYPKLDPTCHSDYILWANILKVDSVIKILQH